MAAQTPDISKSLSQILDIIKEGRSFCLVGHQNPDADVIGGQLALLSLIKRLDPRKEVTINNDGIIPRYLNFLAGFSQVKSAQKVSGQFDVLISLECSGADRMGNIIDLKNQVRKIINLDHHMSNSLFGTVNVVDPKASSIAEIIFKILEFSKLPMSKEEALCLYVGMVTDTGCFRYGNTTAETHAIAATLIALGLPVGEVSERVYMSRTKEGMKLMAYAFSKLQTECDDHVAVIFVPAKIIEETNAKPDDMEEVVNVGLQQGSVKVSVLLREKPNSSEVKVSLRSKGEVDIHQVARKFGGGGHKNAAGFTMTGSLDDIKAKVMEEIKKIV